jgi:hypothetical protein
VDDGLDSVGRLIGLAKELRGIDPERVTTVTMPYAADPANPRAWVVPMPGDAERLFAMVRGDVPLDSFGRTAAGSSTAAASPSPAATVDPAAVRVTVQNGSGVAGRAAAVTLSLRQLGFAHAGNGGNAAVRQRTTTLDYAPGDRSRAAALAAALHLPATALRATASAGRPLLVIGADWPQGSVFPQTATPSAGAVPTTAARQSGAERKCAKVNPVYAW